MNPYGILYACKSVAKIKIYSDTTPSESVEHFPTASPI